MAQSVNDFGLFRGATVTDAGQLQQIMVSTPTRRSFVAGYEGTSEGLDRVALGVDCDLVRENIYVGDAATAQNLAYLRRLNVTHILNVAEGHGAGMVPTNAMTYAGTGISYLGISALDQPAFDIAHYFHQAAAFIDSCGSNGNVLVHCLRGRSRSAAVVLAYLMMRRHIPAPMAMKLCCSVRAFHLNIGFLEQLAELHNSLCSAANN
ncbi:Dual specificity protein phosphatase 3 [Frankliniella fusca]|uniref:Dual specificity protein phosphatase n=1 Tax=Frankliniella fusca TaxID=407009 RepID=A0AAE1HMV6_9NEOP|nr:Dual specificity protein phosphatase 3 [Frankliniella fusca]